MSDPLASAKAVFRRADHHIQDLENAVELFRTKGPYTTFVEYDPGFGKHILKVRFVESAVEDTACIMFDAVNNLRSSLDQMTYAIARRHTGVDKFTPFPFASDIEHWPDRINGLKKSLPPEVLALFQWYRPYKGGNNALWALNHLANFKKHAVLVPVGFGRGAMLTFPKGRPEAGVFVSTPPHLSRQDEVAIMSLPEGHPTPEIHLSPTIVLTHSEEIIDGKHPVSLIDLMRNQVDMVLRETASVCRQIGVFK